MALIAEDASRKARFDILVSIPGVSQVTAFTLLIEMPELGELDEKAAAALSGLAPVSRQSGRWTGRAFIAGGRAIVRHALYMPPSSLAASTQISRQNTTTSSKQESHPRSPLQPSCESSSSWQTHFCETTGNGSQNPLDQNGYSKVCEHYLMQKTTDFPRGSARDGIISEKR